MTTERARCAQLGAISVNRVERPFHAANAPGCYSHAPVMRTVEADDFAAEVREGLAAGLGVDEAEENCAAVPA